MNHGRLAVAALLFLVIGAGAGGRADTRERRLRGSEALGAVYSIILDARFEQVKEALRRACPPAPPEACELLQVTSDWWRIQMDPLDRSRDHAFSLAVDRAIAAAEAWRARAPADPEAWFYLGAAYALRVQFRVLREERFAAARDGKRIKSALERAVALDPRLQDAYFGIGMYRYYAAVAPATARLLRWLLLLPGGHRKEGLEQMLRTQKSGELLRDEADFQLHLIYLWYENRATDAAALLEGLRDRHPANPLFPLLIADLQDVYLHDPTASLHTYERTLQAALTGTTALPQLAEVRARLGLARQFDLIAETDLAIEQLNAILALEPQMPYSAEALASLRLGHAYDRLGQRDLAGPAYGKAMSRAPADDPLQVAAQAKQALARQPDPRAGRAYRVALQGWRALQQGQLDTAEALLSESLHLRGEDPVSHYRYGRVRLAQRDENDALRAFDQTLRWQTACPPTILASAYLEAGRIHERAGRGDRAAAMYRHASGVFGASRDTRLAAQHALARLTPPS